MLWQTTSFNHRKFAARMNNSLGYGAVYTAPTSKTSNRLGVWWLLCAHDYECGDFQVPIFHSADQYRVVHHSGKPVETGSLSQCSSCILRIQPSITILLLSSDDLMHVHLMTHPLSVFPVCTTFCRCRSDIHDWFVGYYGAVLFISGSTVIRVDQGVAVTPWVDLLFWPILVFLTMYVDANTLSAGVRSWLVSSPPHTVFFIWHATWYEAGRPEKYLALNDDYFREILKSIELLQEFGYVEECSEVCLKIEFLNWHFSRFEIGWYLAKL